MTTTKNVQTLMDLDFLLRERERIEKEMGRKVWEARRDGHSWAAIGHSLHISKQAAQKKYGEWPCDCGCGGSEADCTTPVPEGPARDLTAAEEEREQLGEWWSALDVAQHGTPERKAAAVEEFEAAVSRANKENPWENPTADEYGTTPIELELICPECGGSSGTNAQHFALNHVGRPGGDCMTLMLQAKHRELGL